MERRGVRNPTPRRPWRIGVYLQLETEHGRGILRGIGHVLRRRNDVAVFKFNQVAGYSAKAMGEMDYDGVIAKVATAADERLHAKLGLPVVNVSGQRLTPSLPTVNTDDLLVGRLAGQHFFTRGFRRFAYCGSHGHLASELRLLGLTEFAREQGLPEVQTTFVPFGDQTQPYPETSRAELAAWLRSLQAPTAVLAFTDQAALEIDAAAAQHGLRVPEEIGILGIGNDQTRLEFAHSEISSFQLNTHRLGVLAAEMLLDALAGRKLGSDRIIIPPHKLVTRTSTDHFAVADDVVSAALDHIREHAGDTIYVEDVAREVGVSRRVLELKFRRVLKSSVYGEVQRVHFERALELMADPQLSLSEIAFSSGFASAVIFSKQFRRRYDAAPSEYRRRLLGLDKGA